MLKTNVACRTYPHMVQTLDEKIYSRRKRMKISQDTLAERTGLTRNCIQQMECYEHLPQTNTLFELMKALKFSEEEIKEFWNEYQKAYLADTELQRKREEDLATIS